MSSPMFTTSIAQHREENVSKEAHTFLNKKGYKDEVVVLLLLNKFLPLVLAEKELQPHLSLDALCQKAHQQLGPMGFRKFTDVWEKHWLQSYKKIRKNEFQKALKHPLTWLTLIIILLILFFKGAAMLQWINALKEWAFFALVLIFSFAPQLLPMSVAASVRQRNVFSKIALQSSYHYFIVLPFWVLVFIGAKMNMPLLVSLFILIWLSSCFAHIVKSSMVIFHKKYLQLLEELQIDNVKEK